MNGIFLHFGAWQERRWQHSNEHLRSMSKKLSRPRTYIYCCLCDPITYGLQWLSYPSPNCTAAIKTHAGWWVMFLLLFFRLSAFRSFLVTSVRLAQAWATPLSAEKTFSWPSITTSSHPHVKTSSFLNGKVVCEAFSFCSSSTSCSSDAACSKYKNHVTVSASNLLTPQDKIQTPFTFSGDSYVLNSRIREDERQLWILAQGGYEMLVPALWISHNL